MNQITCYIDEHPDDRSLTPLTDIERDGVLGEIAARHGLNFEQRFFWTSLKDDRLLLTDEHDGVEFLTGLLPDDAAVVFFDCDDFDHGYRTRYADAARVIGESSYFEYLIYAIDTGGLLVENHHNELFVVPPRPNEP